MQRAIRLIGHGLAALGGLLLLVTATPVVNWWARAFAGPWSDPRGDVLIVLGGDVAGEGIIGRSSFLRATYAVLIWREGGWKRVLLSGHRSTTEPMRRLMISEGIPEQAIQVEDRSRSTRENALFTAQMGSSAPGQRVLLTSDYHMYRAWRVFRKAGLDTVPRPLPDALKRGQRPLLRWEVFLDLVGEATKVGYYRVRGWM